MNFIICEDQIIFIFDSGVISKVYRNQSNYYALDTIKSMLKDNRVEEAWNLAKRGEQKLPHPIEVKHGAICIGKYQIRPEQIDRAIKLAQSNDGGLFTAMDGENIIQTLEREWADKK